MVADLRSDTITKPTPEMYEAIASAELGDDVLGDEPTVHKLEELSAAMTGKEAAVFVPSGTMGNQICLRLVVPPAEELVCDADAHVVTYEHGGAAQHGGIQSRTVSGGPMDVDEVAAFVRPAGWGTVATSAVSVEQTHIRGGGAVQPMEVLQGLRQLTASHGMALHCDGARIWNASVALGAPAAELVAPTTTAMFCLSKGLGAPVGSVLCGPADVIGEAHAWRRRRGGAMRQAGVIAAAGLVALDAMVERLADDHRRARRLGDTLAERFPGSVDPDTVETNIVWAAIDRVPGDLLARLRAEGIWALALGDAIRFVTHKDVDDADMDRVVKVLRELE